MPTCQVLSLPHGYLPTVGKSTELKIAEPRMEHSDESAKFCREPGAAGRRERPERPGAVSSLRNHHKTSGLDLWIILPLCFFMGRKQLLPGLLLLRMATAPGVVTASSSVMLMKKRERRKTMIFT